MSIITSEFNNMRKSQRFDIPIQVAIDGKSYQTVDWSMTGVGISVENHNFKKGDKSDAYLILPFSEANINIKTELLARNIHGNICGFEITNMSDKNKRVLRHFMTMILEGNGDKVEDLISDFNMPVVESPINESILLDEQEEKELSSKFTFKSIVYIVLGIILIISIIFTSIYNIFIVYNSNGVVFGKYDEYNIEVNAKIDDILVKPKDIVSIGKTLFLLDSYEVENRLKIEKEKLKSLNEEYLIAKKDLDKNINFIINKRTLLGEKIAQLELKKRAAKQELSNAKILYLEKIITLNHLSTIENKLFNIENMLIDANDSYIKDYNLSNAKDEMEKELNVINKNINRVKVQIDTLEYEISKYQVKAIHNGVVHRVNKYKNEFVKSGDVVLTVETTQKPFVTTTVEIDYLPKIHIGSKVLVFSLIEQKKYDAIVESIDFLNGSNYGTVKINFIDKNIDLPYNSSVSLIFLR